MPFHPRLQILAAATWLCMLSTATAGTCSRPVLLIHGMTWQTDCEDTTWGICSANLNHAKTRWTGMIGYLESQGLRYGGTLCGRDGRIEMTESQDPRRAGAASSAANLFVLKFSQSANVDGLALKSLELAEAIKHVRRRTGADRVRLVAHSAGGLVARVYLQGALPGVRYHHDVDRLVTIATPHLGSELASHFGDYLGTRATSLKPEGPLVRALNSALELPADVKFASIVVRGIAADQRGQGEVYHDLVDRSFLERLPIEYRLGGDQVVHVVSQNLRLAPCAARYEQTTGRPVQYILARVPDPSPEDWSPSETRVHVAATKDPTVQRLVGGLVCDGAVLWQPAQRDHLAPWVEWQARLHAGGALEQYTIEHHPMSEVRNVQIDQFTLVDAEGGTRSYAFSGKTWSRNRILRIRRRWMEANGLMNLTFDRFGRVLVAETNVH